MLKRIFGLATLIMILLLSTACSSQTSSQSSGKTNSNSSAKTTANANSSSGTNSTSSNSNTSTPQKLTKIKVGYDGFSMSTAPLYYTYKKGIFKKYGLDPQLVYVKGGSTLTQAVVGGSFDIAQNGYLPAISAIVHGANLTIIGGISNKLPFQMVVKSTITNASQLKGKKIAISRFGGSSDKAARMAIKSLGLTANDVSILQIGGEGERQAALLSGQVDASMDQYPITGELVNKGYKVLVDLSSIAGGYPNTGYVTQTAYLKAHPDIVKRFFEALSEGLYSYRANKQDALKYTAELLKIDDPSSLSATYDFYTTKVYPTIPKPTMDGIQVVLNDLATKNPKAAKLTPAQITNTTAFDQLQKEGFFNQFK